MLVYRTTCCSPEHTCSVDRGSRWREARPPTTTTVIVMTCTDVAADVDDRLAVRPSVRLSVLGSGPTGGQATD